MFAAEPPPTPKPYCAAIACILLPCGRDDAPDGPGTECACLPNTLQIISYRHIGTSCKPCQRSFLVHPPQGVAVAPPTQWTLHCCPHSKLRHQLRGTAWHLVGKCPADRHQSATASMALKRAVLPGGGGVCWRWSSCHTRPASLSSRRLRPPSSECVASPVLCCAKLEAVRLCCIPLCTHCWLRGHFVKASLVDPTECSHTPCAASLGVQLPRREVVALKAHVAGIKKSLPSLLTNPCPFLEEGCHPLLARIPWPNRYSIRDYTPCLPVQTQVELRMWRAAEQRERAQAQAAPAQPAGAVPGPAAGGLPGATPAGLEGGPPAATLEPALSGKAMAGYAGQKEVCSPGTALEPRMSPTLCNSQDLTCAPVPYMGAD